MISPVSERTSAFWAITSYWTGIIISLLCTIECKKKKKNYYSPKFTEVNQTSCYCQHGKILDFHEEIYDSAQKTGECEQ